MRTGAVLLAGVSLVVALMGCTSAPVPSAAPVGGPWAPEIASAKAQATSDFERTVFADGVITRAEYVEAVQRYVDCMKQHGYQTEAADDLNSGVFVYRTTQAVGEPDIDDGISDGCTVGNNALIAHVYVGMLRNPLKEDPDKVILSCLQRKGVAPTAMTVSEFHQLIAVQGSKRPWDEADSRVELCWENPSLD